MNEGTNLPTFNDYLAVKKSDVEDAKAFIELIEMFHLLVDYEESRYYILRGSIKDIADFKFYWNTQ